MEKLFLLFLFVHVSSPVKHSLTFLVTGSSGITNFPEVMASGEVDNIVVGSCDTIKKKVEPKHDLVKTFLENNPEYVQWCEDMCFQDMPDLAKGTIHSMMQVFSQTGGVHILQMMCVTEWDDETGEVDSFIKFGYDGEDLLSFDLESKTWKALKPEVETIKQSWNAEGAVMKRNAIYYTQTLPELAPTFVVLTIGSQLKTALPSVSLLQQTPSSPVRCFASGFYPERASLFWRKDGDDLHEDVEHGEILPNTDETFQMSVDLKVSSSEDWRRYECVFQLSGVKDDIVTKLDKTAIRTNWEEPSHMTVPIIASVAVLVLLLIAAVGFIIYRHRKKASELSEQLNQRPE